VPLHRAPRPSNARHDQSITLGRERRFCVLSLGFLEWQPDRKSPIHGVIESKFFVFLPYGVSEFGRTMEIANNQMLFSVCEIVFFSNWGVWACQSDKRTSDCRYSAVENAIVLMERRCTNQRFPGTSF
jgi:hypothetical protein